MGDWGARAYSTLHRVTTWNIPTHSKCSRSTVTGSPIHLHIIISYDKNGNHRNGMQTTDDDDDSVPHLHVNRNVKYLILVDDPSCSVEWQHKTLNKIEDKRIINCLIKSLFGIIVLYGVWQRYVVTYPRVDWWSRAWVKWQRTSTEIVYTTDDEQKLTTVGRCEKASIVIAGNSKVYKKFIFGYFRPKAECHRTNASAPITHETNDSPLIRFS